MAFSAQDIKAALRHLRRSDPVMKDLIRKVGPFQLKLRRDRFATLVRSIISQQISVAAARAILSRLVDLIAPEKMSAEAVLALDVNRLREIGVSRSKATYLLDLARKVSGGQVNLTHIGRKTNEGVINELVQVKGIGRWTAEMFLIFSLGRLDIFPVDDLGIRSAIKNLYGYEEMPDHASCHQIASAWEPYASVASWYCWRSLE